MNSLQLGLFFNYISTTHTSNVEGVTKNTKYYQMKKTKNDFLNVNLNLGYTEFIHDVQKSTLSFFSTPC